MLLACCLFGILPWSAQSDDPSRSGIPELDRLLDTHRSEQENAGAPFREQRETLRQSYRRALESAAAASSQSGDLDAVVAIRRELALADAASGEAIADPPSPEVQRLRAIYTEQIEKIAAMESEALKPRLDALQQALATLEGELTRLQRVDDALAVRAVRNQIGSADKRPSAAPSTVSPAQVVGSAVLRQKQQQGGRLRVSGDFLSGLSAEHPSVADLPTDVVAVRAYRTAWIAIRKNGSSLIVALNADRTEALAESRLKPEMWVDGHDPWIHTREPQSPHRLVNWEMNMGPLRIRNPVAIAGAHACALFVNARGEAQVFGGGSAPARATPPDSMLKGVARAYSTKLVFMLVNAEGEYGLWNYLEGRAIDSTLPQSTRIAEAYGGEDHFVILDSEGSVHALNVESVVSAETQPPAELGEVIAVRAGGRASAVQTADGRWRAWGCSSSLADQVNQAGLALDLGLFSKEAEYLVWIEPVD